MKNSVWLWIPRIFIMLIIIFLSLFGLDVFEGNASFGDKMLGFLIHSMPSIILLLILILTWMRPLFAGILFVLIGVAMTIFFGHYSRWDVFFVIDFPVILIGSCFLIYEFFVNEKHANTTSDNQ